MWVLRMVRARTSQSGRELVRDGLKQELFNLVRKNYAGHVPNRLAW
jgi:hypothetical protein